MLKRWSAVGVAVSLALFALAPTALAQDAPEAPAAAQPDNATGKIVMYRRESAMGLAIGCPIRYQGREVIELGRGKYAEWSVQPGRYILSNKTSSVEVAVEPGETRYVRCQIKSGFLTARSDLQIVDNTEFDELEASFERKELSLGE